MSNPRRIGVRATRVLAEAWEHAVRRQVTSRQNEAAEVRLREPLESLLGGPALTALTASLSRTEGWEQGADGVFRHELTSGYMAFDPATGELEIVAREWTEVSTAGEVPDVVEAEGVGRYYDDGWGGIPEEDARRAAEEAEARLDQARREADESAGEAVHQQAVREAEAAALAARTEKLRRRAVWELTAVGIEARTLFHQALGEAYRGAIFAYATAQHVDSIRWHHSGGVLDIEFQTAEAGAGFRTKFRYRSDTGKVELFEVDDVYTGPRSVHDDARHDRAAADVAQIIESRVDIWEVLPTSNLGIPPPSSRPAQAQEGALGGHGGEWATEHLAHERASDRQLVPRRGWGARRRPPQHGRCSFRAALP